MQVVRVEFVTHCNDVQEAVDIVSSMLPDLRVPDLRALSRGSKIESWDIYSVDESVTTMVSHPVEDGRVIKNHGV
jgi:hypothetical protein